MKSKKEPPAALAFCACVSNSRGRPPRSGVRAPRVFSRGRTVCAWAGGRKVLYHWRYDSGHCERRRAPFEQPLPLSALLKLMALAGKKVAVERKRRDRAEKRAPDTLVADGDRWRSWSRWAAAEHERIRWSLPGKPYASRLLVGTGKYRDFAETRAAVEASGAEIVTVAIRRTNIGQNASEPSLLDALPPSKFTYLPNTAGCYSADDAVRTLRLARELLDGHDLVKLEVLGDPHTLYPNMPETLKAAEQLVKEGFKVMVYCSDDPIQAQMLEANRLRRGDAARLAHRLGHGHPQSRGTCSSSSTS